MKCLVVGSSGQIGSALCLYLKSQGHQVRHFDIARTAVEDLRIPGRIDNYMQEAEFVFFLAFNVGGSTFLKSFQNTYEFIDDNVRLMQVTFDALRRYKKPFIFMSTQMSNMNFSIYGTLKRIGEFYTHTLNGIVTKAWNVYGIETDPTKTHVITDFVKMAMDAGEIRMKTDGEDERQFLYADDCCEALLTLAEKYNEIPRDKELHITTFKWIKICNVAKIISQKCGNIPIIMGKETDTVQLGTRNEPDSYILSLWQPKIDIEDGIEEIIKYYKSKNNGQ